MKPCPKNQKPIAWLVLNALDPEPAGELKAHLEQCVDCREYFQQVSGLGERLGEVGLAPEVVAPAGFHRRLQENIRSQTKESWFQRWWNFRFEPGLVAALGGVAVVALVIVSAAWWERLATGPTATALVNPITSSQSPAVTVGATANVAQEEIGLNTEPTLSQYRRLANRSLESLDEVISSRAERGTRIPEAYLASIAAHGELVD